MLPGLDNSGQNSRWDKHEGWWQVYGVLPYGITKEDRACGTNEERKMQQIPKTAAWRMQKVSLSWGGIEYSERRVWAGTKYQLIVKLNV